MFEQLDKHDELSEKLVRRNLSEGGYPGWSPYNYTLCNPLRFVDLEGTQVEVDEDSTKENIWNKFLRFMGLLSETNYRYEQQDIENDIDILDNSPEMKGVEILSKEIDKAKIRTVKGIDKVHDIAATTSGVAAGASLLTIYAPQVAGGALTVSMGAGIIAGGASFANYLVTGKNSYFERAAFEFGTLGLGASVKALKTAPTLTQENVIYLNNTIKGWYSSFTYGIGLGLGF